ncbi:DNA-directed RNA polymerase [Entamoeba marina]
MTNVELRKTFQSTPTDITQTSFDFYSPDEIRRLSVKEITKGSSFDLLGNPEPSGLYDPALGPTDRRGVCQTCGLPEQQCPGHFGHVELEEPLYQPLLLDKLLTVLRSICIKCKRLKASRQALLGAAIELARLDRNDIIGAMEIHQLAEEAKKFTKETSS